MKQEFTWIAVGVALTLGIEGGCGSAPVWNWPWYAPSMSADCYQHGSLLGKQGDGGWPDQPMSMCQPDPSPSGMQIKCGVFSVADVFDIKDKYERCVNDLIDCQKGPKPQ